MIRTRAPSRADEHVRACVLCLPRTRRDSSPRRPSPLQSPAAPRRTTSAAPLASRPCWACPVSGLPTLYVEMPLGVRCIRRQICTKSTICTQIAPGTVRKHRTRTPSRSGPTLVHSGGLRGCHGRLKSRVASQEGRGVAVGLYIKVWLRWRPSERGLRVDKNPATRAAHLYNEYLHRWRPCRAAR